MLVLMYACCEYTKYQTGYMIDHDDLFDVKVAIVTCFEMENELSLSSFSDVIMNMILRENTNISVDKFTIVMAELDVLNKKFSPVALENRSKALVDFAPIVAKEIGKHVLLNYYYKNGKTEGYVETSTEADFIVSLQDFIKMMDGL